jgi:chorismate synthase
MKQTSTALLPLLPLLPSLALIATLLPHDVSAFHLVMGTGNTFGRLFRISTWGESHGGGVGVQLDGCPPRIPLTREDVQIDLDRRRPGQSRITTP